MLALSELVRLTRTLRNETVLSVYIGGASPDPANRRPWRIPLENALKDIRTWLSRSSHVEREDFEKAAKLLKTELGDSEGALGSPGWVAFITPERVWRAEPVPAPLPTLAVWSTGICVSPFIRALKQERPVFVVVTDSVHADLYRYEMGKLTRLDGVRSDVHGEEPEHMGDAPSLGHHQGVHGMTGRDALERDEIAATAKMLRDVSARIATLAGRDDPILIGGISSVAQKLFRQLEPEAGKRALLLEGVDIHMTEATIKGIVERGASALRNRRDRAHIEEIVDLVGQEDRGALGELGARQALEQHQVAELYVTQRFLDADLADGEVAVRAALDQGAMVEEVSGDAADLLDEHGGIGARLRFRVPATVDWSAAGSEHSA